MSEVTVAIAIAGLPAECPECGHQAGAWPLACYGNRVGAACPACYVVVAWLAAAREQENMTDLTRGEHDDLDQ